MQVSPILGPVLALIAWTLIMMLWMYAVRLPAIGRSRLDLSTWRGGTAAQLDAELDPKVQWKAHNYNHLTEQPTLFYALCLTLALMGEGDGWFLRLAWAYVLLRIAHSLFQATSNLVRLRFLLFIAASLALIAMTLGALAEYVVSGMRLF